MKTDLGSENNVEGIEGANNRITRIVTSSAFGKEGFLLGALDFCVKGNSVEKCKKCKFFYSYYHMLMKSACLYSIMKYHTLIAYLKKV